MKLAKSSGDVKKGGTVIRRCAIKPKWKQKLSGDVQLNQNGSRSYQAMYN